MEYEILDGDQPKLTIKRVGFGPRFAAMMIDSILFLAVISSITFGLIAIGLTDFLSAKGLGTLNLNEDAYEQLEKMISQVMNIDHYFVFVAVSPLLGFLYNLIEGFAGASPGKMILGLKIANQDGTEADIKTYMIRWALKNASGILSFLTILTSITLFNSIGSSLGFAFFVGCFFVLGENKQGFHDMISKTAIYRNRDLI